MIPYISPTVSICHVDRVLDGDTISCDKIKIRLCAIDSPEKSQAYGAAATTFLTKLVLNQNIRIVSNSLDMYNRVLGEVWLNNRLVNAEMLRAGMAYRYGECPTQKHILESAEKLAIANKIGVWQRDNIRPWNYRYRERHNQPIQ
jgi:micrococcal nuclease